MSYSAKLSIFPYIQYHPNTLPPIPHPTPPNPRCPPQARGVGWGGMGYRGGVGILGYYWIYGNIEEPIPPSTKDLWSHFMNKSMFRHCFSKCAYFKQRKCLSLIRPDRTGVPDVRFRGSVQYRTSAQLSPGPGPKLEHT